VSISPSRIFHVNVNATDLDRSVAFYRDLVGLEPVVRTAPAEPQPGGAFGLPQVQWDAWMMYGSNGTAAPVLDLLEWKVPRAGAPAVTDATAPGFTRLCFTTSDVASMHERLVAAGVDVWSEPVEVQLADGTATTTLVCSDPDGTQIGFVQGPDAQLSHIVLNCIDLDRSVRYYADVIGLTLAATSPPARVPGRPYRLDGDVERRLALLQDPGSGFAVELVEWLDPPPGAVPARRANDLGIFRMAWITDDVDADHRRLDDAGVACFAPPASMAMGPGLPDVRVLFWTDPDGACLELIETPRA
jgi:catechol 2,3-dioxygenase-like lactoylglutathione lyase family enzyme